MAKIRPEIKALISETLRPVGTFALPTTPVREKANPWVEEHNLGRKVGFFYEDHFARFRPIPTASGKPFTNYERVTHLYEGGEFERVIQHNHPYGEPCWPHHKCQELTD